ncbi:hypothetical protein ACIQGZ_17135 [Streptomyces sp. NPDC092296]|uniref:hypothetical protein n=1 Tax=Streptomyces sp. NPDC092296 TaxID=3366012 RepID=UPI0038227137
MPYRLRADALREAAALRGDHSVRGIIKTTGLESTVIRRNLGGYNEPSLRTLMRFIACYGGTVEGYIREIQPADAQAQEATLAA